MHRSKWMYAACAALLAGVTAILGGVQAGQDSAHEFNAAGVGHYNAGEWAEAIDAFEAALLLSPENGTLRRNLANTFQAYANQRASRGDFEGAIDLLDEAIQVDPENPAPLTQHGAYSLRLERVRDAVFRLEEAVELDPFDNDALELLGDAYYRANDLSAAMTAWRAVLTSDPNRPGLADKLDKAEREATVEGNFRRAASQNFEVSYPPHITGNEQQRVLTVLERAYRDIGRRMANAFPPAPIQVIVYTAEDFSQATQLGDHVGAVYDGKIRIPVQDAQGNSLDSDELERRLYHEYVHVVVRYLAGDHVPWWYNEGLAETLSKELSTRDLEMLRRAEAGGNLYSLADLEGGQLGRMGADELRLAYVQSHAAVDYLWRRFGASGMINYLAAIDRGADGAEALREAYNRTHDALEQEVVREYVR